MGGRIFAGTAGATFGNRFEEILKPMFSLIGLILPLFLVPFSFRFAGKGLALGQTALSKARGVAENRYGKNSELAKARSERHRNKMSSWATSADSGFLKRKVGAVRSGASAGLYGSITGRGGAAAAAYAKRQAQADKHDETVGTYRGSKDTRKELLEEADRLMKSRNPEDRARGQRLRDSFTHAGRAEFTADDAKEKVMAKAGLYQGVMTGAAEIEKEVARLRGTGNAADAKRADDLAATLTTSGRYNYMASKSKSEFQSGKTEIASYNEGKKQLGDAAKAEAAQLTAEAGRLQAAGDLTGAAELRAQADRKLRSVESSGKLNFAMDQGKQKMIDEKIAIGSHMEGKVETEKSAKDFDQKAANATARAARARTEAARQSSLATTLAAAGGAGAAKAVADASSKARLANAEAESATAEARNATSTAANLRGSLTTAGKFAYGVEQGARTIGSQKAGMAAYNQARQEVTQTAEQLETDAASARARAANLTAAGAPADAIAAAHAEANAATSRAQVLRQNLTTSGRMGMQVSQEVQNVVGEQSKLEGLRRAEAVSAHDTARQLEAQASVESNRVLAQRTQEEKMREITVRNPVTGEVRTGRVESITPDKYTMAQLEQEAVDALNRGNLPEAAAKIESLGRSSRGRSAAVRIRRQFEGNEEIKPILDEATRDMREKAPSAFQPEDTAFDQLKPTQFQKMDKREKYRYLEWAQDPTVDAAVREVRMAEAAGNVLSLSVKRNRQNVDDGDVRFVYGSGFMANPDAVAKLRDAEAANTDYEKAWLDTRNTVDPTPFKTEEAESAKRKF